MPTYVGVGFSDLKDSREAGIAAAREALINAAFTQTTTEVGAERGAFVGLTPTRPAFVLLFSTGRHDPQRLVDGVREVLHVPVFGGYGVGIITNEHLGYDGHEVGLALFTTDKTQAHAVIAPQINGREAEAGASIGATLALLNLGTDDSVLLLYDSVHHVDGQPRLNMATPMIDAIGKQLGGRGWPRVAGMGMIGDMQLNPTHQWYDGKVVQQSAMALAFTGGIRMDTIIMHGCRPAGRYYTITKTDGPVVLEIDGRPALQMIHEMLGPDAGLTPDDYSFFVTLGVNKGDQYGPYREDDYANRLCIGVDAARQGLIMFENDLKPGMQVQLMRRALDFGYIGPRTRELLKRAEGRRPIFAFYIDCAGRAAAYCGMDEEEAVEVQRALPPGVPLLGVYSGVEIAKVGGAVQALDWTGVLCLFSE